MSVCSLCGGTTIEYDAAMGSSFCGGCGNVVEESAIVNEVMFGETSGGAAIVHGTYVSSGSTGARMGGRFGNRSSGESREQTIQAANEKIENLASLLHIPGGVVIAAKNMYKLALEHKFTKGRKTWNVVAVCLYVACRQQEKINIMLIDFSDELKVNVFELGHIYLMLVQTLNLRLHALDPAHYISRFAALLEFGDETSKVAHDAARLVRRFKRDWMVQGRRPAGICGAALLLAARMNNFRRSVEEIVQVVKIADVTIRKRLEEFKNTPSGQMTVADFLTADLDEEMNPPSFIRNREKELESGVEEEEVIEKPKKRKKNSTKGKEKRKRMRIETEEPEEPIATRAPVDPALLGQGILANSGALPLFLPEDPEDESNIDPSLRASTSAHTLDVGADEKSDEKFDEKAGENYNELESQVDAALAEDVESYLQNDQGSQLAEALDEVEQRRLAGIVAEEDLAGLDEDELDRFICTPEEVKIRERVWVEMNKEYLEALAVKGEVQEPEAKSRKRRKKNKESAKPRDASTPSGNTTAEAVQNMLKKNPKYSKRINYNALKDLLEDGSTPAQPQTLDEEGMYTMDTDKDDEELLEVVIENDDPGLMDKTDKTDELDADEDDYGDDKEEGYSGWEDEYYQQEL